MKCKGLLIASMAVLASCGAPTSHRSDTQIIHGVDISETRDFPAVVSIFTKSDARADHGLCTASFIEPKVLITAAHCVVDDMNEENFSIKVLATKEDGGFREVGSIYSPRNVFVHPGYRVIRRRPGSNSGTRPYQGTDVAVIHMEEGESQYLMSLTWRRPEEGANVAIVGFGGNAIDPENEASFNSGRKRFGYNTILRATDRGLVLESPYKDIGHQIGSLAGTAKGDSGGPMVSGGRIVGLTSWGYVDPAEASPSSKNRSYFFPVYAQRDWIRSAIRGRR